MQIFRIHGALIFVAPSVVLLGQHAAGFAPLSRWRSGTMVLVFFAVAANALIGLVPANTDYALIGLFAVLYPTLLWLASRYQPAWSAGALFVLAVTVVWHSGRGTGVFTAHVGAAQLFLAVAGMWTLTLSAD